MAIFKSYLKDFSHLLFPHNCVGCGTDVLNENDQLCLKCFTQLPETGFFHSQDNPVEKAFYGRLDIAHAAAAYYFTKDSLLQRLMVRLKYRNDKKAGLYLGRLTGSMLKDAKRFNDVDVLIPLPLNPKKEQERGYNQAAIICEGIAETWPKPVLKNAVIRKRFTETQTHQNRISRWQNMEGVFAVADKEALRSRHILIVDDVVTTGATLEACASIIGQIDSVTISIATVAYTI